MKTFQEWLLELANIPSGDMGHKFKVGDEVHLKHHSIHGVKSHGMTKVIAADEKSATVQHPEDKNKTITVKQGMGVEHGYNTLKGYYALHRDI